jgi:hypothetical protein
MVLSGYRCSQFFHRLNGTRGLQNHLMEESGVAWSIFEARGRLCIFLGAVLFHNRTTGKYMEDTWCGEKIQGPGATRHS